MTDIEALQATVEALRAGDGGMMYRMHLCKKYYRPNRPCEGCPCYTGLWDGECCKGLYRTAQHYLAYFHRGSATRKALQKRFDTLADYLERLKS